MKLTRTTNESNEFVLTLTPKEMKTLAVICGNIEGNNTSRIRKLANDIYYSFEDITGKEITEDTRNKYGVVQNMRIKKATPTEMQQDEPKLMEEIVERCDKCRFYKLLSCSESIGICHRYPPTLQPFKDAESQEMLHSSDWCGEFQMRDNK